MYRSYIILFLKLHLKKYLFCDIVILDKKFKKGKKKENHVFTNIYYISIPLLLGYTDIQILSERKTYI